jgi:phospholipid transport system substrate-binding protein
MLTQKLFFRSVLLAAAFSTASSVQMLHADDKAALQGHTVSGIATDTSIAATSPRAQVSLAVQEIVATVQKYPGEKNLEMRRTKLREVINPRFDFEEMSKRCLGPEWNNIKDEQRNEFVRIFSNLLAKTYLNRIETVQPGMVKVEDETLEKSDGHAPQRAYVRTSVTKDGNVFPLHYRLKLEGTVWRVYDVVIENIGLVANYRNEFSQIIRKDKFEGLMNKLRSKV